MAAGSEYLRAVYRVLLDREPDELATAVWGSGEIGGPTLQAILETVVQSQEFSEKRVAFMGRHMRELGHPVIQDHSQNGELTILLRHLVAAGASNGIVVDVGAFGRVGSNSYDLLHQFGWRGLLIEANPERKPIIAQEFAGCSYDLVSVAVSDYAGEADFHLAVSDEVSSLVAETAAVWGESRGQRRVQVERLPTILHAYGIPDDFDLLTIDAEGEDVRVLNDTIASGYRPRWVIIEASNDFAVTALAQLPLNEAVRSGYTIVGSTRANLVLERGAAVLTRPECVHKPCRPEMRPDSQPCQATDRSMPELLERFESLGDNCEFGFLQRAYGVETSSLFRWASSPLEATTLLLQQDFLDIFSRAAVAPYTEGMAIDRRYGIAFHVALHSKKNAVGTLEFISQGDEFSSLFEIESQKVAFLVAKTKMELQSAAKTFVFKSANAMGPEAIARLFSAFRMRTRANLLLVTSAPSVHHQTVQLIGPGLKLAKIANLASFDATEALPIEGWTSALLAAEQTAW